jgi:hypothetical protein
MIGAATASAARARPCPCNGHAPRSAAAVVPAALSLPREGRRPLLRAARRRNTSVATASTGPQPAGPQQQQQQRQRPDASAAAASATASAGPAPAAEPETTTIIDIDAIPDTRALGLPSYVSATLPRPRPWAPPLLTEEDQAPDEFLRVTSLRPGPEWYPAWMRYRRRDGNDIFWTDKIRRCSTDIPEFEQRWTVFSTVYYVFMHWRFRGLPVSVRYLAYAGLRALRARLYEGHKALVLWQCKLEAALAARAVERRRRGRAAAGEAAAAAGLGAVAAAGGGARGGGDDDNKHAEPNKYAPGPTTMVGIPRPGHSFSRTMALRRLHWRNSPVAELLYLQNVLLTGRVHMLPPRMMRQKRPTLFWLF